MNYKLHHNASKPWKAWRSKQWRMSISFELLGLRYPSVILVLLSLCLHTTEATAQAQDFCFDPAVNYAAGSGPQSVFAADLDGDGDLDLVVSNNNSNNVSILKNNGNGTFAAAVNYTVGTEPSSVFAADLDGDGDLDLAVANWFSNNVSVLRNNGNATLTAAVNYAAGSGPRSVFAADLDADGDKYQGEVAHF